jgi:NAD(P)-dependent dehydrogenase (short-subunit alcohol dehydrogenase family)
VTLKGKTVLVTGSTDGVGRAVARGLALGGANVLVHGRDAERGGALVAEIEANGGKARFLEADLASLAQVRELADTVRAHTDRLNMLINNAGIGFGPPGTPRQTSLDGYELRFAVNYLAHFLLTALLLPLLKAVPKARIVNVASLGQHPIDFDDVMLERSYDGRRAYAQSKLAQIIATFDLAAMLDPAAITVNALHPATYMDTTMVRQGGITPWSTVDEGAQAILNLALSPQLAGRSGLFFDGLREARPHAQAFDRAARDELRSLSLRLTGLPPDFSFDR